MFGARSSFVPISSVEGGLPAAGLIFGEIDFVSNAAQNFHRVDRDLRKELVDEAWDE